jgi:hypothetical protein
MPADCAPRSPGPGEGLVHQILRRVAVTDGQQDGAEAVIRGIAVELREVQSVAFHTHSTRNPCPRITWIGSDVRVRNPQQQNRLFRAVPRCVSGADAA